MDPSKGEEMSSADVVYRFEQKAYTNRGKKEDPTTGWTSYCSYYVFSYTRLEKQRKYNNKT